MSRIHAAALLPALADSAAMETSHAASLILLPGLASDEALFADLPQRLSTAGFAPAAVVRVHFGHDSLPAMADALLAECPGPLVLAGTSMGGSVALHAALRAPDRIRGLALLGSSARADTPELLQLRSDAVALFEQGRIDEVVRPNVLFAFHPANQRDDVLVEAYLAMMQRAGGAALARQNRALMARPDLRPLLPRIACPTLAAVGEADLLTPPEHAAEMAAAIRGATLHRVAGAGHLLTMERPAEVAALLVPWLERLSGLGCFRT
jgi:pimeloyl-ACP methyl ester carboxylesterase